MTRPLRRRGDGRRRGLGAATPERGVACTEVMGWSERGGRLRQAWVSASLDACRPLGRGYLRPLLPTPSLCWTCYDMARRAALTSTFTWARSTPRPNGLRRACNTSACGRVSTPRRCGVRSRGGGFSSTQFVDPVAGVLGPDCRRTRRVHAPTAADGCAPGRRPWHCARARIR